MLRPPLKRLPLQPRLLPTRPLLTLPLPPRLPLIRPLALLLPLLLRQRLLLHLPPHLLLRHRLRSLNCYTLRGRRVLPDSRLVCSRA